MVFRQYIDLVWVEWPEQLLKQLITGDFFYKKNETYTPPLKKLQIHIFIVTRVSQKFYNILVQACLWHKFHVTEAVYAVEATYCGR